MKKKLSLNRADFLSSISRLKRMEVELDDGIVFVREMSGKSLLEYDAKLNDLKTSGTEVTPANSLEIVSLLVARTVCDENGELLFTENDVEALSNSSMSILKLLAEAAMKISGLPQKTIDEAKNTLGNDPTNSSTSA